MVELTDNLPRHVCIRIAGIGNKVKEVARIVESQGIAGCDFLYEADYENYSQLIAASGTRYLPNHTQSYSDAFIRQFHDTDLAVIIASTDEIKDSHEVISSICNQSDMTYLVAIDQGTNDGVIRQIDSIFSKVDLSFQFGVEHHGNVHPHPMKAFQECCDLTYITLRGLIELVTWPAKLVCIDYVDLRIATVNQGEGRIYHAEYRGKNRADLAINSILSEMKQTGLNIEHSSSLIINMTAGLDIAISEFDHVRDVQKPRIADDCIVVLGANGDERMQDRMRITVIATLN